METNGQNIVKAVTPVLPTAIEQALIGGDLSRLDTGQRMNLYKSTCESLGLNPLTKPFEYITLNGKLTLYARRDCTDQLRKLNRVSVMVVAREKLDDIFTVCARATMPDGRTDESIGAVNVSGLRGDNLANALMKAETKAKRRVTLSICGLGFLDESEVETIQELKPVEVEKPARIESRRATIKPEALKSEAPAPVEPEAVAEPTIEAARSYRFTTPGVQIRKREVFGEPMLSYSIELLEWMFTHDKFYSRLNASDKAYLKFVTENWGELTAPPKEADGFKPLAFEDDEIPDFSKGGK